MTFNAPTRMKPVPTMRQAKLLVAWLLFTVVCGSMVFFINDSLEEDLNQRGVHVQAFVTFDECGIQYGRSQNFSARAGEQTFDFLSCPPQGVDVGEKVELIYDPQDLTNSRLVGTSDDGISTIFGLASIAALVVLIGWAVRVRIQPVPYIEEPDPIKAPVNTARSQDKTPRRKSWPRGYRGRHR